MRREPALFPVPRSIERLDTTERHRHELDVVHDPTLPPQGYALTVDATSATLRHADEAGVRYGRQTLAQLSEGGTWPTVTIADHPDIAVRGFMLDVSRDRVPTRATLDRLVDVLEACRFNHLQLYVEHAYAYVGHETVWADASPIDADDLRWLDERCAAAGIEVAANQNCFGHLTPWLSHEDYRGRAECPDGYDVAPGLRFPPSVLHPDADNADFALALVREQAANLRSRSVNIGCDETFELGMGRSRERVERDGRGAVYAEHLRRLVEPLVAEGRTVQFWADVVANHPDQIHLVPTEGTVALVWNYDGPGSPTVEVDDVTATVLDTLDIDINADPHFATCLAPFADAGITHWVVPGTSTWSSLVGRVDNALANLRDAAEAGLASGATGYLVTDWGDGGHHQPLTVSFLPIAYGGAVAWGVAANRDLDVTNAVDRHVLDNPGCGLGAVLDSIGRQATRTGVDARNSSPIHHAVAGGLSVTSGQPAVDSLTGVLDAFDTALSALEAMAPGGRLTAEMIDELAIAVALASVGAETMAAHAGAPPRPPRIRADELDVLIERYRSAWLTSSRPGGLDRSTGHLLATRDRLRRQEHVDDR